jgi:hypothetical protein
MRGRDTWKASRAADMSARPTFPRRHPRLREDMAERGKRRKKKGGDIAPDRRVSQVSDPRARPSWWRIGGR